MILDNPVYLHVLIVSPQSLFSVVIGEPYAMVGALTEYGELKPVVPTVDNARYCVPLVEALPYAPAFGPGGRTVEFQFPDYVVALLVATYNNLPPELRAPYVPPAPPPPPVTVPVLTSFLFDTVVGDNTGDGLQWFEYRVSWSSQNGDQSPDYLYLQTTHAYQDLPLGVTCQALLDNLYMQRTPEQNT